MALFSVKQLLEMAVRDEETGVAFYTALAEGAGNAGLRVLYSTLAAQEEHHAERFAAMAASAAAEPTPPEQYPGQWASYLQALLDSRAFPTPAAAAEHARTLGDAGSLRVALEMEKATLLFFLEMRAAVGERHAEVLDAIVDEERGHVAQLASRQASH
jgi:rubrerythrin